jgi:predicted RNA polymerase sigma factor
MTLRDYFAAKAMQGILYEGLEPVETAKHAYEMADAMLKAREQK